jgi:two-component system sensor histidine kinase PilS (NtrC family)
MSLPAQSRSIFNYYNLYRAVVGLLLLSMTLTDTFLVGDLRHPATFQLISILYLAFSVSSLIAYHFTLKAEKQQILISLFTDIVILHALFFCGEGITGGLSNLLVISIAAGNILVRGNIGYFLAAIASMLSLALASERFVEGIDDFSAVARAGMVGAVYFASAFFIQYLSSRILKSEILAQKQKRAIKGLVELNHQVIQSMRTGIIVCDENLRVQITNQACSDLIGLQNQDPLPNALVKRLHAWQNNPSLRTEPFQAASDKPQVQANFSRMRQSDGLQTLIFLEDTRKLAQQAQQLKLASLGRLTASIAHEIRNPLGAISHATQLLAESEQLDHADRKMTDIIQRHCLRMNSVIEDTLSLSRRTKPETEEIELDSWVTALLADAPQIIGQDNLLKFKKDQSNPKARFDPNQIQQVVVNLIQNARRHSIKSTDKGAPTPIEVLIGTHEKSDQAFIEIQDFGEGVADANLPHLFEPFFTTENEGTGLGLYLSRELCESNQAQLNYVQKDTQGACFRIVFAHYRKLV